MRAARTPDPGVPRTRLAARGLAVRAGDRLLLEGLDLQFDGGQFWCLLGPNGAGKTTLLATLAGLLPAAAGAIELAGRPLADWRPAEAACVRGFLPQHSEAMFGVTALDAALLGRHPHLGLRLWERAEDVALARDALARLGAAALAPRDVDTLSGGERQRVALASLIAQDPLVWLLDEPLTHLDLHHQVLTMRLLREQAVARGRAVVASVHDLSLAARHATHALVIGTDGRCHAGLASEVLTAARPAWQRAHPVRRIGDDAASAFIAE